jgi:predicted nucleic acid-binding protein
VVSNYAVWCIDTTPTEILTAFQVEDASNIGFWNAFIAGSALKSGTARILSEDLNAGQTIAGSCSSNMVDSVAGAGDPSV